MIYNWRRSNCNRQLSMETSARPAPGGRTALVLLLAINLFNYIDRYVLAAVEPEIRSHFFRPDDPNAHALVGFLGTAFLVSYMVSAPIFGWFADRMSRWIIIGVSVILWSAATAASGLAGTFALLLITRLLVGVGEGGYGPAAPTIIADLFPLLLRGRVLSYLCRDSGWQRNRVRDWRICRGALGLANGIFCCRAARIAAWLRM